MLFCLFLYLLFNSKSFIISYVGHGEGAPLTTFVQHINKPYIVPAIKEFALCDFITLFDEVDECDPKVLVPLKQIFDTLKMDDRSNPGSKKLNLHNGIFILNTNLGSLAAPPLLDHEIEYPFDLITTDFECLNPTDCLSENNLPTTVGTLKNILCYKLFDKNWSRFSRIEDVIPFQKFTDQEKKNIIEINLSDAESDLIVKYELTTLKFDRTSIIPWILQQYHDELGARSIRNSVGQICYQFVSKLFMLEQCKDIIISMHNNSNQQCKLQILPLNGTQKSEPIFSASLLPSISNAKSNKQRKRDLTLKSVFQANGSYAAKAKLIVKECSSDILPLTQRELAALIAVTCQNKKDLSFNERLTEVEKNIGGELKKMTDIIESKDENGAVVWYPKTK